MIAEDTKHNKQNTNRKQDLQFHDTDAGTSGIVNQLEDMCKVSDSGETKIDDKDTSPTHHGMEETQEDIWHSPKRNTMMRVKKDAEQPNERTRSMSRRVTH